MGLPHKQIAIEERCEMARLRAAGSSVRQIAAGLDRAPSTVARELKRNGSRTSGYRPVYAEQQARARRWSAGESRCTYRQRHDGDPVSVATAGRQAVTFDNGTEFARHHELHALGIETFFCDTHSPWQKGGVENAMGRMRRTLPRKTDLAELSDDRFTELVQAYNNTPRKCLGYQTPAELFWNKVLHFKRESTSRLPPE